MVGFSIASNSLPDLPDLDPSLFHDLASNSILDRFYKIKPFIKRWFS
jgi:hypothetical protein